MDSKLTGMWVSFFTAAGIPSEVSATYALTFAENRIQNDMLLDLNKEYLKEMGIGRMGDVIAILRHAKQVHESTARDKVLGSTAGSKVPVAAVTGRTTISQPSSPAIRILEHYTRNPAAPDGPASQTVKRRSNEMVSPPEKQKKKLIRYEPSNQEAKEGPNITVFSRLGSNETVVTNEPPKPIFARLGSKFAQQDQHIPVLKDALKYEGILKSPPTPKNTSILTNKTARKIATMRADETPVSVKEKLAVPKTKSVKFSNFVQYKEIEACQPIVPRPIESWPIVSRPKATQIFNKPERMLSIEGVPDVKSRLGVKSVNNLTITKNVFKRF